MPTSLAKLAYSAIVFFPVIYAQSTPNATCSFGGVASPNIIIANVIFVSLHRTDLQENRITDLRTPTPFAIVESLSVTGCSLSDQVFTVPQQATAVLSGTTYNASALVYSLSGTNTISVFTHTFTSLLMTMLAPRDFIIIVYPVLDAWIDLSRQMTQVRACGCNYSSWFASSDPISIMEVPTSITLTLSHSATPPATTTANSTSTTAFRPTDTPGQSGLSSGAIGGIVAGIMYGSIIIAIIFAYTYLRSQKLCVFRPGVT
jgi:hypothetical protein